jgi:hypothetical protein
MSGKYLSKEDIATLIYYSDGYNGSFVSLMTKTRKELLEMLKEFGLVFNE